MSGQAGVEPVRDYLTGLQRRITAAIESVDGAKFLNDAWMKEHGFTETERELGFVEDLLKGLKSKPITASSLSGES